MKEYIDKSALVAEIERSKKYYENIQMIKPVYESNIEDFDELLSFLDTLEVKEKVNTTNAFIEKAEKWLNEHILDYVYAKEWGQGVGVEGELFDDFKNAMKGE